MLTQTPLRTEHSDSQSLIQRLDSIQVLRGIAAMAVVFNHAGLLVLERSGELGPSYLLPSVALARVGAIGVDLFFVISGFVMAMSAAKFDGARGAGLFLAHRYNRIAPLYYLFCLVMLANLVIANVGVETQSVVNSLIFVPLFDDAIYSWPLHYLGWTLAFEFVFYLIVAALIVFGCGRRPQVLLAVVALMPLLGFAGGSGNVVAWQMFTNPILWEFALGVGAYILWRRGALQRVHGALVVAAVLSTALVVVAMFRDAVSEPFIGAGSTVDGSGSVSRLLYWGIPAFLVFCATIGRNGAQRHSNALLKQLGDASYSLYLSHLPVMLVSAKLIELLPRELLPAGSADVMLVVLLAGAAFVGLQIYRLLEKPMLDSGQRVLRRLAGQKAQPPAERRSAHESDASARSAVHTK